MSAIVEAPTVMAAPTRAGEVLMASTLRLPAATTVVTPELMRLVMASSKACVASPVKLKEATAGPPPWLLATQSIPEIISEAVPGPASLRTLTATTLAALATPLY